jgi:nucleotide-binding universal stress UspA family protein
LKEIAVYADVVVGINGLPGDRDAVALAKTLSRAGARLTLVNVRIVNVVPTKGSNGAFEVAESELSHELLQRQREALADDAAVVSVPATSVGGGLHQVAEDHDADLIVVGSCHRNPVGRLLAGDDARSALHRAPCAVAVAPAGYGDGDRHLMTIAVAYDGSDPSRVALAHAGLLAADLGATLVARDVVELRVYGAGSWAASAAVAEDPQTLIAATRKRLGPLAGADLEVIVGPVREELAAISEIVDLMVCGSREQGAAKRVLMGSTSDYLARHSRCPLLVTPNVDDKQVAAWHELREVATITP